MENECLLSDVTVAFTTNSISIEPDLYVTVTTVESAFFDSGYKLQKYTDVNIDKGNVIFSGLKTVRASELNVNDYFSDGSLKNEYYKVLDIFTGVDGKIVVTAEVVKVNDISHLNA